jgi:hypothetical protein
MFCSWHVIKSKRGRVQMGTPVECRHRGDHIGHVARSSAPTTACIVTASDSLFDRKTVQLSLSIADVITWSKTDYETYYCIHHSAQRGADLTAGKPAALLARSRWTQSCPDWAGVVVCTFQALIDRFSFASFSAYCKHPSYWEGTVVGKKFMFILFIILLAVSVWGSTLPLIDWAVDCFNDSFACSWNGVHGRLSTVPSLASPTRGHQKILSKCSAVSCKTYTFQPQYCLLIVKFSCASHYSTRDVKPVSLITAPLKTYVIEMSTSRSLLQDFAFVTAKSWCYQNIKVDLWMPTSVTCLLWKWSWLMNLDQVTFFH